MAITRRQFVSRLGAMAAAVGLSQSQLAQLSEAFAHNEGTYWNAGTEKPKVLWVHGAECTGCSTSVLGLFENAAGLAVEDQDLVAGTAGYGASVAGALGLIGDLDGDILGVTGTASPHGHRTLNMTDSLTGSDFDGNANSTDNIVNIADVLIDFISLEYHETVGSPAGDLAYALLADNAYKGSDTPFVLVVEGAVTMNDDNGGNFYWGNGGDGEALGTGNADQAPVAAGAPWCSIGADVDQASPRTYTGQTYAGELTFEDAVLNLASQATCLCSISIGQCATFGGYPACVSPTLGAKQTPAFGVYDFLSRAIVDADVKARTLNRHVRVPGCPTNPWWFTLTVVLWLIDATNGPLAAVPVNGPLGIIGLGTGTLTDTTTFAIQAGAVDANRRLLAVYGTPVHGPGCPRYHAFTGGRFAEMPGDDGCLLNLGCKGPSTRSLCSLHGWNGRHPRNDSAWDYGVQADQGSRGGFCVTGGAPCMGCTERGYPDSFVPFVER